MAECSEISLLLGPFDDGELEPHEMQEVARHLAACSSCETILNDYSMIGRELRNLAAVPSLDGFADSVLARIGAWPAPWRERFARWFDGVNDRISATVAMGCVAAAVAVITAIIVTPYAQNRMAGRLGPIASVQTKSADTSAALAPMDNPLSAVDATPVAVPVPFESKDELPASGQVVASSAGTNSHAIISRLESQIPSVALWSEPQNDTTVIWLPEQQQ